MKVSFLFFPALLLLFLSILKSSLIISLVSTVPQHSPII